MPDPGDTCTQEWPAQAMFPNEAGGQLISSCYIHSLCGKGGSCPMDRTAASVWIPKSSE